MELAGIKNGYSSAYQISEKAETGKIWELSDSLKEEIIKCAKEDAAQNIYMGNAFLSLRKNEVGKVAPDRAALIGKLNQTFRSDHMENMKKLREADEKWLCMLFGKPYEARFQGEGTGSAIHVYDENGDEILTYTEGAGWHEKESRAESEVHGTLKTVYYDAYRAARQEIKKVVLPDDDAALIMAGRSFDKTV